jgi:hypothetical protein
MVHGCEPAVELFDGLANPIFENAKSKLSRAVEDAWDAVRRQLPHWQSLSREESEWVNNLPFASGGVPVF